ncbi:MAG: hypothetical protein GY818_00060, partial [Planctomycetaceae bacterium]|nr:hypothetical protein [Planctomycetaceae bacterium]
GIEDLRQTRLRLHRTAAVLDVSKLIAIKYVIAYLCSGILPSSPTSAEHLQIAVCYCHAHALPTAEFIWERMGGKLRQNFAQPWRLTCVNRAGMIAGLFAFAVRYHRLHEAVFAQYCTVRLNRTAYRHLSYLYLEQPETTYGNPFRNSGPMWHNAVCIPKFLENLPAEYRPADQPPRQLPRDQARPPMAPRSRRGSTGSRGGGR